MSFVNIRTLISPGRPSRNTLESKASTFLTFPSTVYNQTPSIIGALVAVLLLILLIGAAVWYFRGNKTIILRNFLNSSNDRSFTNPFYSQEVTMSHLQQV